MNLLFKKILILLLAIILLSASYAQKVEVKADRDSILIGEVIQLSIEYPIEQATTSLNVYEGDSIGNGFEVFEVFSKDTLNGNVQIKLGISSFEPGLNSIPPFSVFYGENQIVSTPIPVFVSLVKVDTSKRFKDIHPVFYDPLTLADKWQLFLNWMGKNWIIIALILLLLITVLWFLFFRNKTPKQIKPEPEIIIPAHIKAHQSLTELKDKELWQKGFQKEYNVQLTEIMQQYITDRYAVPTKEKTSAEILHSIRFVEMEEQNKNNLRQLLMLSDLVKFAKEKPTESENNQVLNNAFDFVETTKKQTA